MRGGNRSFEIQTVYLNGGETRFVGELARRDRQENTHAGFDLLTCQESYRPMTRSKAREQ
ncbi:MAG: hypothetical protein PPP56_07320 [Longimonas sp.]|uniref:hypothetical protein n=1 Tax=Longimonas sp. TaxID=2039626 RepID=UPI00335AD5EC